MKLKRIAPIAMAGLMAVSLAGCGGSDSTQDTTETTTKAAATEETSSEDASSENTASEGIKSYADIQLGTDFTDLTHIQPGI